MTKVDNHKCSMGFELRGNVQCATCGARPDQTCGRWVTAAEELFEASVGFRETHFGEQVTTDQGPPRERFLAGADTFMFTVKDNGECFEGVT